MWSRGFKSNFEFLILYLKRIAIAGIHTGIGKTIAAAVIAETIGADYWKPIQAGIAERDTEVVKNLISNGPGRVHQEAILLTQPMSPHAAAAIDHVDIDYKKFKWPETENMLIVETAGGILSPMSANTTMADFMAYYRLPVILVTQNYLGSINHTLMSIEVLKNRGIKLIGIVINGIENVSSETFIEQYAHAPILARIPHFDQIHGNLIIQCAANISEELIQNIRSFK